MHAPFLRLVWKEYRSQRNLWLALFAFAMCLVLWMSAFLSAHNRSFPVMIMLSGGIGLICATCSLLYLFAGEEDNGTAPWLRNLPMKTSTLLLAKLTTTILATLLYLVVSCISVCVIYGVACLIRGESIFGNLQLRGLNSDEVGGLIKMVATTTAFLSCTLFWSLYCRKVIAAISGCGVSLVVFMVLYGSPQPYRNGIVTEPIIWWSMTLSLLAVGLSIYILPGWHRGIRRLDAVSLFQRFQQRQSVRIRESGTGFLATRLRTWAMCSPVSSRTFRVLLWQQLRSAIPFAFVCLLLLIPAVWLRYTNFFQAPLSLLSLIVLECGLRTFRNDQRNRSGLFWAHRGVSSTTVLLTRHAVWLTVLFTLAAAFVLAEWLVGRQAVAKSLSLVDAWSSIQVPFGGFRSGPHYAASVGFRLPIATAWLLGGYAIGHLCSVWIRKSFVATFVGIIAFLGFTCFVEFNIFNDVSCWITLWPLICVLFLLPMVTRRYWIEHKAESWKYDLRHVVLALMPALFMWPLFQIGRLSLPLEILRLCQEPPSPVLFKADFSSNEKPSSSADEWGRNWELFARSTRAAPILSSFEFNLPYLSSRTSQQYNDALRELDEIHATLSRSSTLRLPDRYRKPWSESFAQPISSVLVQEARNLRDEGDMAGAISRLVQAKRWLCYLRKESSDISLVDATLFWHQVIDQHLHDLIADDRVSLESLQHLQSDLVELASRLLKETPMLHYRAAAWLELHHSEMAPESLPMYARLFKESSWSERIRLLSVVLASDIANVKRNADDLNRLDSAVRRILATANSSIASSYFRDTWDDAISRNGRPYHQSDLWVAAVNSHRATQLVVALQIHRRVNGQFPKLLNDLVLSGDVEGSLLNSLTEGTLLYSTAGFGGRVSNGIDRFNIGEAENAIYLGRSHPVLWLNGDKPLSRGGVGGNGGFGDTYVPVDPKRVLYIDSTCGMVIPLNSLWGAPIEDFGSESADVLHRDDAE